MPADPRPRIDEALAEIGPKLDQHVAEVARTIAGMGYPTAVATYFLLLTQRQSPDAIAALAAVAVGRLAQASLEN